MAFNLRACLFPSCAVGSALACDPVVHPSGSRRVLRPRSRGVNSPGPTRIGYGSDRRGAGRTHREGSEGVRYGTARRRTGGLIKTAWNRGRGQETPAGPRSERAKRYAPGKQWFGGVRVSRTHPVFEWVFFFWFVFSPFEFGTRSAFCLVLLRLMWPFFCM